MSCAKKFVQDIMSMLTFVYIISCIAFFIIDIIALTKLDNSNDIDIDNDQLSSWCFVYLCFIITKLITALPWIVPYVWVFPGIYLFVEARNIKQQLKDICDNDIDNIDNSKTCLFYNNEFKDLVVMNQIETWISVVAWTIIIALYIIERYCCKSPEQFREYTSLV